MRAKMNVFVLPLLVLLVGGTMPSGVRASQPVEAVEIAYAAVLAQALSTQFFQLRRRNFREARNDAADVAARATAGQAPT